MHVQNIFLKYDYQIDIHLFVTIRLQLHIEALDNYHLINFRFVLDIFGTVGVSQGGKSLVIIIISWGETSYHHSLGVTTKRILDSQIHIISWGETGYHHSLGVTTQGNLDSQIHIISWVETGYHHSLGVTTQGILDSQIHIIQYIILYSLGVTTQGILDSQIVRQLTASLIDRLHHSKQQLGKLYQANCYSTNIFSNLHSHMSTSYINNQ